MSGRVFLVLCSGCFARLPFSRLGRTTTGRRHGARCTHTSQAPVSICGAALSIRSKYEISRRRPYRVECTGSLLTSEVKQHRARLVLGWGTAWEDLRVLSAFLPGFVHHDPGYGLGCIFFFDRKAENFQFLFFMSATIST